MAIVLDSCERLSDGTELMRWHLLDDNYQLVKPIERFLRFKQRGDTALGTLKTYSEKLKQFWAYLKLKELDWRDFNGRNHLSEFGYWYMTGKLLNAKESIGIDTLQTKRSERTVNLALTVITQFYEFHTAVGTIEEKHLRTYRRTRGKKRGGMLAGHFKESPVGMKTVHYREPKKYPGTLNPDQIGRLINACRSARDKLILWLLADTGMRIGELLGLHWSDLEWGKRTLKIVRRENPNQAYAKGQERELSIARLLQDYEFHALFSEYADKEYPHKIAQKFGHDMMFVVLHMGSPSYGQPLRPQNVNKLFDRLHKKTGIDVERIYPHLFRHSFATYQIREARKSGESKEDVAKAVQRQLGHQSIATTLDIYDHSFNEAELGNAIRRLTKE
ncbi:tyrosine-type recombinase/integrase [Acaryochloris sp. CCMEE 5410]|uniref:tyrosine-type recombinase/integrase n=1 Tax=Acaryochloris sp. CCMEE 5410 TaxID=310037 RepID=UPI000248483D|nr:tyrosine-type recombinase/integrase [Acaryochloris sp. CCMEE 5410]KAI9129583.1 tyrosine-type recombinase/integrase [Acaryochloris sp. CCMEE 5410]